MAVAIQDIGTATYTATGTLNLDAPSNIATGDVLIAMVYVEYVDGDEALGSTPSGWTLIDATAVGTQPDRVGVYHKLAEAGDVGASTFPFTSSSGTDPIGGIMFRVDGNDTTTGVTDAEGQANANSSTITAPTITPDRPDSLIIFMTYAQSIDAHTVSNYAIATSSPTFTEAYDVDLNSGRSSMAMAAGVRTAITATGAGTADLSASDPNAGYLLAVQPPPTNVTVSPSVVTVTTSVLAPTITGGATVSPTVVTVNVVLNAPTITTEAGDWANSSKNAASATNVSKNAASPSNTSKTSTTWTNQTKS